METTGNIPYEYAAMKPEPETASGINAGQCRVFSGRPTDGIPRTQPELDAYDLLDSLHIPYTTLTHPAAHTMEQCEEVRKRIGAPVFKNLFLTNKQHTLIFLLMLPAGKRFKTKYLSPQLGCARLSFASPEEMADLLQIHPGAVSPLGLIHDRGLRVRLLADDELREIPVFACHPCVNTASVALSMKDLTDRVIPATGHTLTWVNLPAES